MEIRKFEEKDAKELSDLIIKTLRISNSRDYPEKRIEDDVKSMQPEYQHCGGGSKIIYTLENDDFFPEQSV